MVDSDDIGTAMDITSLSWHVQYGTEVTLDGLQIFMGTCANDELTEVFDDNFISGTRIKVYDRSTVTLTSSGPGSWLEVPLDRTFWYNGDDNLLMEFSWSSGSNSIYVWGWDPGLNQTLFGSYGASSGDLEKVSLHMRLNGALDLTATTFGAIKATLGN